MSNVENIEQQVANLQINHRDGIQIPKKVAPAVPPKPKKSQPSTSMPQYGAVLNNTDSPEKSNLYMNSPTPYTPLNVNKNEFNNTQSSSNGGEVGKFYSNEENFYDNQPREKFEPKYRYDEKNLYSNVEENNDAGPHIAVVEGGRSSRNALYSNVESTRSVPGPQKKEKDLVYSNIQWNNSKMENAYSNVPSGHGNDDLPPPPPELTEYVPCVSGATASFSTAEELPPPPSPVSSSYSELRRATYQNNYSSASYSNDIYCPKSQSSSTYESIYEPINPRPPSQLSCNYSMYSGYGSTSNVTGKVSPVKEVDALTDLLVQGMEDSPEDGDIYGICDQCGKKVEAEGTGCSAMDKVFHITCFCCYVCHMNLQGKPFYSLEGKPYCEEDYLNTLEKCCVCTKPILDRIIRATGKPYHPSCFTCVVCGQSLDGIPFTVDATNQIHCIQCFHKKFAPRCCVCKMPIMPEPGQDETVRVVALDRSFHIQCYKCEDCGLVLSSDSEGRGCYPLDDHVLCKSCNAARVQALTSHMTTEL